MISRYIWVLAHTYLEESLSEHFESWLPAAEPPKDEPQDESWWDSVVRIKDVISDILM